MAAREEELFHLLEKLSRLRNECSCGIFSNCGLSDMTVKQTRYLKVIDKNGDITFSQLARITRTSKPTITEMINRFVRMDCVYRERCQDDGRIQRIHLTEKGQIAARAEMNALMQVVTRMMETLTDHDIDTLIEILKKVR